MQSKINLIVAPEMRKYRVNISKIYFLMTMRQSPQKNAAVPSSCLKDPKERGLCTPHFMQLMVSPVRMPSYGDPVFFDL
jgi:hypothetical protein